jgi:hypothetical protein
MQQPAQQPVLINVPQQQDSLSKVLIACLIVVLILVVGCIVLCLIVGGLPILLAAIGVALGTPTPVP